MFVNTKLESAERYSFASLTGSYWRLVNMPSSVFVPFLPFPVAEAIWRKTSECIFHEWYPPAKRLFTICKHFVWDWRQAMRNCVLSKASWVCVLKGHHLDHSNKCSKMHTATPSSFQQTSRYELWMKYQKIYIYIYISNIKYTIFNNIIIIFLKKIFMHLDAQQPLSLTNSSCYPRWKTVGAWWIVPPRFVREHFGSPRTTFGCRELINSHLCYP